MLLLLAGLARAAPPVILGAGDATSVVLIVAEREEEKAFRCDDQDGDGAWTCPAGDLAPRLRALGVLIDGTTLLQTRDVALGENPPAVRIERVEDQLRVETTPAAPRPASGRPRPGLAALVVEVQQPGRGAPRLDLSGSGQQRSVSCEDGGRFPDRSVNDGIHTCLALVGDGPVRLTLRAPEGAPQDLGEPNWTPEQGLRQLRVDENGANIASWAVLDRSAARRADGPRASDGGAGPGPAQPPPPPGGASAPPSSGPLALGLATLGVALLGGLVWKVLGGARPELSAPVPPPPWAPGVPTGSVILRVPAGQTAAALGWVVARVAAVRPTLVVERAPGAPSAAGIAGIVLGALSSDADDVADAARDIARRAIVPPAVVASGNALSWVGGVGRSPEGALLHRLSPGAILILVLEAEQPPVALPEVALIPHEGQWRTR